MLSVLAWLVLPAAATCIVRATLAWRAQRLDLARHNATQSAMLYDLPERVKAARSAAANDNR